jgi:hypothetical protein
MEALTDLGRGVLPKRFGCGVNGELSKPQLFSIRERIKGLRLGGLRCDQARFLCVGGVLW